MYISGRNVCTVVERWILWKFNDPHTCWTISTIVSNVHWKNFTCLQQNSNTWPLRCLCSALTNQTMMPIRCEQVNLSGWCVPTDVSNVHVWDNCRNSPSSVKIKIHKCILLIKHKVKMSGYWPSSLFAFLWTETKSRTIKM